jgi:hypothetical protein
MSVYTKGIIGLVLTILFASAAAVVLALIPIFLSIHFNK